MKYVFLSGAFVVLAVTAYYWLRHKWSQEIALFVVILVGGLLALYAIEDRANRRQAKTNEQVVKIELAICERNNTQSRAVNQFHRPLKKFMVKAAVRLRAISSVPGVTAEMKKINLRYADEYIVLANALTIVPLDDCKKVVSSENKKVGLNQPVVTTVEGK